MPTGRTNSAVEGSMSRTPNGPRDGRARGGVPRSAKTPEAPEETCDLCGSAAVQWRNCKLICLSCRAIVRSCGDL